MEEQIPSPLYQGGAAPSSWATTSESHARYFGPVDRVEAPTTVGTTGLRLDPASYPDWGMGVGSEIEARWLQMQADDAGACVLILPDWEGPAGTVTVWLANGRTWELAETQ